MAQLADYLHELNSKDELYKKYLTHKLDVKKFFNKNLSAAFASGYYGIKNNQDYPITAFQCFICEIVHKQLFNKRSERLVYDCPVPSNPFNENDISWNTFWTYGKCELKALQYYINNKKARNITKKLLIKKSMEYLENNEC